MEKYIISCESYIIDELTDKAKLEAYGKWKNTFDYPHSEEIISTLKEFCRLFDVECTNWDFDEYNHHYMFKITNDVLEEISNIKGNRLAVYMWNNYSQYITKGKFFSLWSKNEKSEYSPLMAKLKSRHSKAMLELDDCSLTGVCFDTDVLAPIINCLTYKKTYDSYEELINDCLDTFFAAASGDYQYLLSFECFLEEARANQWKYNKNGTAFFILPDAKIIKQTTVLD